MFAFEPGVAGWVVRDAESGHVLAVGDRATIRAYRDGPGTLPTNEADRLDPLNLLAVAETVGPACLREARAFASAYAAR